MNYFRAAAIDVGTNSVRLLIAEAHLDEDRPVINTLHRLMTITRLGEGVDKSNFLEPGAVARTIQTLKRYRELMRREVVEGWRVVATSAVRDASNAREFLNQAREIMEMEPKVISGQEEAALSFLGATYGLGDLGPRDKPLLVIDLGGGSTEIIVGRQGEIMKSYSADIGCVRMSERFLKNDPPSNQELEEMEAYAASVLAPIALEIKNLEPGLMIGLAGTATTLSGLKQGLESYDGDAINHSWLSRGDVEELYERLYSVSTEARREMMRLEPGRADVIIGGTGVLLVLLRQLGIGSFLVSEKDILDGLVITAARQAAPRGHGE